MFSFTRIRYLFLGNTALHWACEHGHKDLVQALVRYHHADGSCRNNKGTAPVHLAIREGRHEILEMLLDVDTDSQLVRCVNPFSGWYPLHMAAYFCQRKCAALLLKKGARVTQLTDENSVRPEDRFQVFHLAASGLAQQRIQKNEKKRGEDATRLMEIQQERTNRQRKESASHPQNSWTDQEKDKGKKAVGTENKKKADRDTDKGDTEEDEEKKKEKEKEKKVFELLDLFLENLPAEPMSVVADSHIGSVLHYFAAINYVKGIKKIVEAPFSYPADETNKEKLSPLLMGFRAGSLDAILELLEDRDVDVERLDEHKQLRPLQLLIKDVLTIKDKHLAIVDKLLEKGT